MSFLSIHCQVSCRIAASILLGFAAGELRAEILLGDEGVLHAEASVEVRYDDNLYLSDLVREADLVITATPGLTLDWGKTGTTRLHAEARPQFVHFMENRQEDDSLLLLSIAGQHDGPRTQFSFDGSYNQIRANSRDFLSASELVRYDVSSLHVTGTHSLSARTQLVTGIAVNAISFQHERFSSSTDVSIPVDLFRAWTARVGGGLQYRYRQIRFSGRMRGSYVENSLGFGTRGEFSPTWSGSIGGAIAQKHGPSNDNNLRLNVGLTWRPDARTACSVGLARDAQPANQEGGAYENLNASLEVTRELSARLSSRASFAWQRSDRAYRDDTYVTAGLSVGFAYSDDLTLGAGIEREENASTLRPYDFTRTVTRLSANYRF